MTDALQLLVFGLTAGAVVALSAAGFTLTFAVSRQVNLAHGNVFALTTVAVASLTRALGVTAATPLAGRLGALLLLVVAGAADRRRCSTAWSSGWRSARSTAAASRSGR